MRFSIGRQIRFILFELGLELLHLVQQLHVSLLVLSSSCSDLSLIILERLELSLAALSLLNLLTKGLKLLMLCTSNAVQVVNL